MSSAAIRLTKLSKRYQIGAREKNNQTLREALVDLVSAPFRRFRELSGRAQHAEHFWALQDVSFEVQPGEVVGVIGRNGAGKSTLLKILSRITEPTSGRIEIRGRIGSLLEVGTGFHTELTGRENVYLNGAILGMKKTEIDRKFEEIVEFAEVARFIDTPVKHYSSGMHMRLAFAVAAHLEPEILLVDEVLAVGDIAFQKKCLGKMGDVARGGRTILFVSHQMNQIRRLCERCIWLSGGRLQQAGPASEVIPNYERSMSTQSETRTGDFTHVAAQFLQWDLIGPAQETPHVLASSGPVLVRVHVKVNKPLRNAQCGLALYNAEHQRMLGVLATGLDLAPGTHGLVFRLAELPLRPGPYTWHTSLHGDRGMVDYWTCSPELIIATQPLTHPRDEWTGILNIENDFSIQPAHRAPEPAAGTLLAARN